jgi:hypothetical protein
LLNVLLQLANKNGIQNKNKKMIYGNSVRTSQETYGTSIVAVVSGNDS